MNNKLNTRATIHDKMNYYSIIDILIYEISKNTIIIDKKIINNFF